MVARAEIPVKRLVADMDEQSLSRLLGLLPLDEIEVCKAPETGLVMMMARDCFDTDFCLGEVLVTVAETKIGNARGYAMVLGDEPRRAVISASVDALLNGNDEHLKTKLSRFMRTVESLQRKKQKSQERLAASTRVQFDMIPEG